jgi:hypothetical protein
VTFREDFREAIADMDGEFNFERLSAEAKQNLVGAFLVETFSNPLDWLEPIMESIDCERPHVELAYRVMAESNVFNARYKFGEVLVDAMIEHYGQALQEKFERECQHGEDREHIHADNRDRAASVRDALRGFVIEPAE